MELCSMIVSLIFCHEIWAQVLQEQRHRKYISELSRCSSGLLLTQVFELTDWRDSRFTRTLSGKLHNLIVSDSVDIERILRDDSINFSTVISLHHYHSPIRGLLEGRMSMEIASCIVFGEIFTMCGEKLINLAQRLSICKVLR